MDKTPDVSSGSIGSQKWQQGTPSKTESISGIGFGSRKISLSLGIQQSKVDNTFNNTTTSRNRSKIEQKSTSINKAKLSKSSSKSLFNLFGKNKAKSRTETVAIRNPYEEKKDSLKGLFREYKAGKISQEQLCGEIRKFDGNTSELKKLLGDKDMMKELLSIGKEKVLNLVDKLFQDEVLESATPFREETVSLIVYSKIAQHLYQISKDDIYKAAKEYVNKKEAKPSDGTGFMNKMARTLDAKLGKNSSFAQELNEKFVQRMETFLKDQKGMEPGSVRQTAEHYFLSMFFLRNITSVLARGNLTETTEENVSLQNARDLARKEVKALQSKLPTASEEEKKKLNGQIKELEKKIDKTVSQIAIKNEAQRKETENNKPFREFSRRIMTTVSLESSSLLNETQEARNAFLPQKNNT